MNGTIITVSQLNKYVRSLLDGDQNLRSVIIKGEISNLKINSFSGHMYLTLKDENATLKAVMFKSAASNIKFIPNEGMNVICQGSVTVYERDGAYQLYITDMQPDGAGAIAVAFEQLKKKLAAQGLFDYKYKKEIPRFPKKIAIITSKTGAAVHDMISVIGRRWPLATLVMCPVSVQGDLAPLQMIDAIEKVNLNTDCDTIIIGRGGGSTEDLWCFNDEALAHAIFKSKVPVISAVGHETDFTICDFVADLRAPTPSAAAELAVPEISDIHSYILTCDIRTKNHINKLLADYSIRLKNAYERHITLGKGKFIEPIISKIDAIKLKLDMHYNTKILSFDKQLNALISKLSTLNPTDVLLRGYSLVEAKNKQINSIQGLTVGEKIKLRFSDGVAICTVDSTEKQELNYEPKI